MRFLIVTTLNLPEAYFLAEHLLDAAQDVGVLNLGVRDPGLRLRILSRLLRNRGPRYLVDLLLGKALRGRYQDLSLSAFPEMDDRAIASIRARVSCLDCGDPHSTEALGFAKSFDADYMLLAGTRVLKPILFLLNRRGAVNRHLGLSPRYRGSDCPVWAMSRNDFDQLGFTIHRVSERVDGGGVLLQRHVPVDPSLDFSRFLAHLNRKGSEGFLEVLERLIAGEELPGLPQEGGGAHYPPAPWSVLRRAWRNHQLHVRSMSAEPAAGGMS